MQHKALDAAKAKADAASVKLSAMENAKNAEDLAVNWSEFLTEIQRCYLRIQKATEAGKTKRWCDRLKNERKIDEMLAYVEQARHSDEHGIDPLTLVEAGSLTIGDPGEVTIIRSGTITSQGFVGELECGTVRYKPTVVKLRPVKNRGNTYVVPRTHLGAPLADAGPIDIARLTIAYVRRALAEADSL